jgi:hypothetical protein
LGIEELDQDCQNFKDKLKKFEPLGYFDGKHKTTSRFGFIDGTPVIFITSPKIFATGSNLTQ